MFQGRLEPESPMIWRIHENPSGWWFGCHFLNFPINIGCLTIPIDELICFRGVALAHQPAMVSGEDFPHQAAQLVHHDALRAPSCGNQVWKA